VKGLQAIWTSPAISRCALSASKGFDKDLAACFARLMLAADGKDASNAEILRLERA
jgi:ABC-type phosphate/phosphonate transport system substrate-binding protein